MRVGPLVLAGMLLFHCGANETERHSSTRLTGHSPIWGESHLEFGAALVEVVNGLPSKRCGKNSTTRLFCSESGLSAGFLELEEGLIGRDVSSEPRRGWG